MIDELPFNTVKNIIDTWEIIRQIPNYEESVSIQLLSRLDKTFTNPKNDNKNDNNNNNNYDDSCKVQQQNNNEKLLNQTKQYVKMLDRIISLLGPMDKEILIEVLIEFNRTLLVQHSNNNDLFITQSQYSDMTDALLGTLEFLLVVRIGRRKTMQMKHQVQQQTSTTGSTIFSQRKKQSWIEFCACLSYAMMTIQMTFEYDDFYPTKATTTTNEKSSTNSKKQSLFAM